jgi:succinate dehydrogenase flavin-adding protein (antitoxin of CptAB toxin-antitoxin module)
MNDYETDYDPWEEGDVEDDSEQYEELDDYDQYLEEHDREMNQWIGWEIKR